MVKLPMRLAAGYPFRIKCAGDADGGWTVVDCDSVAHAKALMHDYPSAEMPCWRNPAAVWNQRAK